MTARIYLFLLLFIASTAATAKPLRIITSIKPVHSLVASITQGVTEPALLMPSNQSPHHYSLRPSERKMLAEADLIFWIGPSLESFMPRVLDSLKHKNKAVSLIQSQGLKLLPTRSTSHGHSDHGQNEHESHHVTQHEHSKSDAHIWLSTYNADVLVDIITHKMVQLDPEHKQQYEINNRQIHAQIAQLRKALNQSLSTIKLPFLTYHDGYQYFENEFNLKNMGFISLTESQPGARHIRELKKNIKQQNIHCIFYDAPTEPPIMKSLVSNGSVSTFMLDPVGMFVQPEKNAWFEIMRSLGKQFINCQQSL